MKKILALLMALMMALSCFAAVAEEEATQEAFPIPSFADFPAFTVEEKLSIDQEQLMPLLPMLGDMPEEAAGMMQMILPIVSNLGVRFTFNQNAQLDLLLKGANVLSAGIAQTEDGFALASDLIPNYVITLKNETIQQLAEQFAGQIKDTLSKIDFQALLNTVMTHVGECLTSLQSAVTMGEPETGEFVIEDITFNTKVPMTLDAKAVAVSVINMIKNIAQDEAVASTVAQLGGNIDLSSLDESLANVENTTEEDTPEIAVELYSVVDEEGNTDSSVFAALAVINTKNEEVGNINLCAVSALPVVKCTLEIPAQEIVVQMVNNVDMENMTLVNTMEVNAKDMYFCAATDAKLTDTGVHAEEAFYFMNDEKPLIVSVTDFAVGGELTMSFDAEGKTALPVEELMADEEGQLSGGLMMDLMSNGLSSLLGKAAEVMPDEVTALYSALTGAGQTAVEE